VTTVNPSGLQLDSHAQRFPPDFAARCVRAAVIVSLILMVYWGTIQRNLISQWIHDANWSHGWLIPVFSLYFLAIRRDEFARCRPRASYVGALILAASLALYFVSAWRLRMAYPQSLSLVGVVFGVTLLLGGWKIIRLAAFPILFLVFAIPLPQSIYVELTLPLRKMASTIAAATMPIFASGLHTEAQAVVIDYVMPGTPPSTLNVEEACSGMRLMMAFVALGVALAYVQQRPMWQRVVMMLSCLPVAVACNAIRVTITGLLHIHGYSSLAEGTPHALLGIASMGIALSLFTLIGYILSHLFITESPQLESRQVEHSD
jgi:exosortase